MDKNGPDQGPAKVEVLSAKLPVPMKDGWPTKDDQYNTAETFHVKCTYTDGVELHIRDDAPELKIDNGILFEGEKGSIFVSRNALSGAPVDELKEKPLPEDALEKVYGGKLARNHMHNLMESIISRKQPVSDVYTHHRAMTVCHLANIAIRLNRTLHWDPVKEQITGDDYANSFLTREQRKGYEVKV